MMKKHMVFISPTLFPEEGWDFPLSWVETISEGFPIPIIQFEIQMNIPWFLS